MKKVIAAIATTIALTSVANADVSYVNQTDPFEGTSIQYVKVDGQVAQGEDQIPAEIRIFPNNIRGTLFGGKQTYVTIIPGDGHICENFGSRKNQLKVEAMLGNKKQTLYFDQYSLLESQNGFVQSFTKKGIKGILDGQRIAYRYVDGCRGNYQTVIFDTTVMTKEARAILTKMYKKMK